MITRQHMLLNLYIFTFVSQQAMAMDMSKAWQQWKEQHAHQQGLVRHAWRNHAQPKPIHTPLTPAKEISPKVEQRFDKMITRNLALNHAQ